MIYLSIILCCFTVNFAIFISVFTRLLSRIRFLEDLLSDYCNNNDCSDS